MSLTQNRHRTRNVVGVGSVWQLPWNGCITDRGNSNGPSSANYDENVNPPVAGTNASLFPAEQYGSCPLQLMGLSNNWTAMNTLVNQMTPNGNTNQAIGLV